MPKQALGGIRKQNGSVESHRFHLEGNHMHLATQKGEIPRIAGEGSFPCSLSGGALAIHAIDAFPFCWLCECALAYA